MSSEAMTPEAGSGTNPDLSIADASATILGLLESEHDQPETQNETTAEAAPVETDTEANEGDAESTEATDEGETEVTDEGETEVTEEVEPQTSAEPDPNHKVKVKVNGQELEVPFSELKAGYQREADYTAKTQKLATERNQLTQEFNSKLGELDRQLSEFNSHLMANEPKKPDASMLDYDPLEYMKQEANYRAWAEAKYGVDVKRNAIQEHHKAQMKEYAAKEAEKLIQYIPDWRDARKATEEKVAIAQFAQKELGFSKEELNGLTDSRAVLALRDAYRYRQIMANKAAVDKKVANVPPVVKPGAPNSNNSVRQEQAKTQLDRFKTSGSIDDLAAILKQNISKG